MTQQKLFRFLSQLCSPKSKKLSTLHDKKKQQKLLKTAQHYLLLHPYYGTNPCRFDVIAFTQHLQQPIKVSWIKNAFQLSSDKI